MIHSCPVQHLTAAGSRCRLSPTQPKLPVAGLAPATHVFEEDCVDRQEGVDDRDEPGQGGLELFPGQYKQPFSLNRTAVDLFRPSTSSPISSGDAGECVDARVTPGLIVTVHRQRNPGVRMTALDWL
jgi:hypothetical protein